MKSDGILKAYREEILALARKHGAANVRVFGSVARGDSNEASDLDLLVDMEKGLTLFDFIAFWQDVEKALGTKVDVATENSLGPLIRDEVLKEAVPV